MSALRMEGVSVDRRGRIVLTGADLSVRPGRTLAVRGPSGAGKSTLLAVACGLLRPDSGEVHVAGQRIDLLGDRARSAARLRHLGLVFQGDELLPELSLLENVSLPLRLLGGPASRARRAATEVMEQLGIGELCQARPAEVSGGQLQRAAIARAVVHEPVAVLADEPTAALDPGTAAVAMNLVLEAASSRGAAVVIVTHDPVVAARCDDVVELLNGRIASVAGA